MKYLPLLSLVLVSIEFFDTSRAKKLNVLFLVSDDMRPNIGAYQGADSPTPIHPKMHTPFLDKLAKRSLLLKRAYVQQAVCSPSRASLLTGRRPDTTRVHDLTHYWRLVAGNFTTIPQYFKEHGYMTAGMGKIFHPGPPSGYDDPVSWTLPYFHGDDSHWAKYERISWTAADDKEVEQYPLIDQLTARQAIKTLKRAAPKALSGERPFFIAAGFHRPHLPFVFPAHFHQYYPVDKIRLADNPYAPVSMPEIAWSNFDELRSYYVDISTKYGYGAINGTPIPDDVAKGLRRAYYSSISYVDSLVGMVMNTLKELGLDNSTIVSFWGDHGWQLGEHGEWCKHTNFELTTHAPMMIRVPGLTDGGVVTERLTEFVDLFPTLAESAGLPAIPLCPQRSAAVEICTEGVSLMPLMRNPTRVWKPAVFSQYPRMQIDGNIIMGYSIKTEHYRYTEWRMFDDYKTEPIRANNQSIPLELYDHQTDPDENINRAYDQKYTTIRKALSKMLHSGWRHALPNP